MTNRSKRPRGTTGLNSSAVVAASITLLSLPALRRYGLPHHAGIFAQHGSRCSVVVIPCLCCHQLHRPTSLYVVVYASISLASLPVLSWHHLSHHAGVFGRYCSHCGIAVVPGLVVINWVCRHHCLRWSTLASR
jgi:hypothetical protein